MIAQQIITDAANLVSGDRAKTHGDKLKNHENIARGWQAYLESRPDPVSPLSALDAANMMEVMKIMRRCAGDHNIDDYIDGAGYAAVAGEIAEQTEAGG